MSGALYGIAFTGDSFEVMIVDDGEGGGPPDGVLRFFAMPGGAKSVEFKQDKLEANSARFANPAHDDPKLITYAREGDKLVAKLEGDKPLEFSFVRGRRQPAPELEAADRAFSADTGERGIAGWMAAFEPDGGMIRKGSRVSGEAIRETMGPVLGAGKLAWAPVASGRAGKLGFTVGKATYTGTENWESSYVTIWRQQADGAWKVWFDTGRPVQK